jgi:hypothetical protein
MGVNKSKLAITLINVFLRVTFHLIGSDSHGQGFYILKQLHQYLDISKRMEFLLDIHTT